MRISTLLIILLLLTLTLAQSQITVTVKGYGETEAQATKDALRNAVEQGAGVKIFSESVVKDFVALKDVIVSESFGLVTSFTKLGNGKQGELFWVEIRANVSKDVNKKWAQIKVIIEQKGRPSIMFLIQEILDGQPLQQHMAEERMRNKFKNLGFEVFDPQMLTDLATMRKQLYSMDQNIEGITALASKKGVDLVVKGMLKASFVGNEDFYGVQYLRHSYAFTAGIYRTDTGQEVGSASATSYTTRHLAQIKTRELAAKDGFRSLSEQDFTQRLIEDILTFWIRDVQEGTSTELIISNVKFSQRKKILQKLASLPDLVQSVQVKHYRNRRLTLNVKSKLNTEELAGKLEQIQGLPLEVSELQRNGIELQYTGD